jgi:hypothetical protein
MQPNLRDLMLGQKSLGTESYTGISSSLSGQPQHHNLTISTGESEDQPGGERMADHSAPHGQHVPAAGEPHQAAMVGSIVCSSGHG